VGVAVTSHYKKAVLPPQQGSKRCVTCGDIWLVLAFLGRWGRVVGECEECRRIRRYKKEIVLAISEGKNEQTKIK